MSRFAFNPITGNLDLEGSGGGGGGDVTINTMDGGSTTGTDFFLEGQTYKTIPIVSTATDSGDTILNNLTFSSPYIVDSNSVDTPGTFSTIQAALDEAFSNGDASSNKIAHILIRTEDSGAYFTEDLNFVDGSSYYIEGIGAAYEPTFQVLRTIVIGNHTTTGTVNLFAKNIYFSASTGFAFTGVALQNFFFNSCGVSFSIDGAAVNCSDSLILPSETLNQPGWTANRCFVQSMDVGPLGTGGGADSTYASINFNNSSSFLGYFEKCTIASMSGTTGVGLSETFAPKFLNCRFDGAIDVTGTIVINEAYNTSSTSNTVTSFQSPTGKTIVPSSQRGTCCVVQQIDDDYNLEFGDDCILVDTSTNAVTVTLMDEVSNLIFIGREYEFKDLTGNSPTNNITIDGNGNLIDNQSSIILNEEFACVKLMWNGTGWSVK